MQLKKVTVLERFDLGPKTYAPGPAEVPADKVDKLREKKLIASEELTEDKPLSGTPLETELLGVLSQHVGESGANEGAVETLNRIITDRDRFRADYEGACKTITAMHAAAVGEFTGPKRGVVEDVEDVRLRAETLQESMEAFSQTLPTLAGLERTEGEDTLSYLQRWAAHFPTLVSEAPAEDATNATPEVTEVKEGLPPLTAEELTTLVGAKAALSLLNGGFDTREKIAGASHAQLEALTDVGDATIQKLRDAFPA